MHQHGNQGGVPPHGGHPHGGHAPAGYAQHQQAQHPGHAQHPGYAQAPGQAAHPGHGAAAHGYAQAPHATHPGGAAPAPRGKKNVVGLAVGGLAVAGAAVAAVVFLGGGTPPLPFEVGRLPSDTLAITTTSLGEDIAGDLGLRVADLPEEAYWSALSARACGGHDVFKDLMAAAAGRPRDAVSALRRDLGKYEEALACGKALAGKMGARDGVYRVSFEKGKDGRHAVTLLPLGVEEMPDTVDELESKSDPSNMTGTRCVHPWRKKGDDKPDCEDRTPVIARLEGLSVWATGRLEDVKAFGSEYSPKADHDDEKLALMVSLAKDVSAMPHRSYGLADGFSLYGNDFVYVRASAEDEETKALREAVENDAVAWALGGNDQFGHGEAKLIIVAKSESRAKGIRSALGDFLTSLGEGVEKAEEAEEKREKARKKDKQKKGDDAPPEEVEEAMKAKVAMGRRALADAKLEVAGDRVILTAIEEPSDEEKAAIERFYDWRKGHGVIAAKIVRGLLEGDEPDEADLDELDERIQKLLDSKWPHDREYARSGLYIPGGYKVDRFEIGDKYLDIKVYVGLSRDDFAKVLAEINDGWKIEKKAGTEGTFLAKKGGEEISLLVGERDGSATLIF